MAVRCGFGWPQSRARRSRSMLSSGFCFRRCSKGRFASMSPSIVIQGREWLLAYPKHPPLSMWLVDLASRLGSARYLAIYLLGQGLALAGLVAATFVLQDEAPAARVLAILIGLATPFMTYMTIQVNHNIGVLPFWGLALAAGYFSFTRGRITHWLLFGGAVGLGMLAKYSILHLAIPLTLLFFAVPEWRRLLATPGPWLAGALAAAIVAPHVVALMQVPNPLGHALRTFSAGPLSHFAMCLGFLLNAALMLALMGIVAAGAVGFRPLLHQVARSFAGSGRNRLALYLHVALFGPIALIALAALLFGVRPRFHWLAPIALSSAVWWADKAKAVDEGLLHRPLAIAGALGALLAGSYVAVRLLAPFVAAAPSISRLRRPRARPPRRASLAGGRRPHSIYRQLRSSARPSSRRLDRVRLGRPSARVRRSRLQAGAMDRHWRSGAARRIGRLFLRALAPGASGGPAGRAYPAVRAADGARRLPQSSDDPFRHRATGTPVTSVRFRSSQSACGTTVCELRN